MYKMIPDITDFLLIATYISNISNLPEDLYLFFEKLQQAGPWPQWFSQHRRVL